MFGLVAEGVNPALPRLSAGLLRWVLRLLLGVGRADEHRGLCRCGRAAARVELVHQSPTCASAGLFPGVCSAWVRPAALLLFLPFGRGCGTLL